MLWQGLHALFMKEVLSGFSLVTQFVCQRLDCTHQVGLVLAPPPLRTPLEINMTAKMGIVCLSCAASGR